jgi:eukaryotic-like serine/threonine-protein kinase
MNLGRYQLVGKLASGGMAEVFLAKVAGPMGFEKKVVVKRILPHLAEDPSFIEMFFAEARLVAHLDHPHIVQIFELGEADGAYFIAMEYIDGLNLRVLLKRVLAAGERLPLALCAKIVSAACEGLAYAHGFVDASTGTSLDLVHRDISPDNILVSSHGAVKLADFGIAKAANQVHRTQTGVVKGKLAYMSPEQVEAKPLDARADLYALAVVLYELLTGRRPFEAESETALMLAILHNAPTPVTHYRDDVPLPVQRILTRALAKEREARYPSCRELQLDLERYLRTVDEPVGSVDIARWVARFSAPGTEAAKTPNVKLLLETPSSPSLAAPVATTRSSASPTQSRTQSLGATQDTKDAPLVQEEASLLDDVTRTDPTRTQAPSAPASPWPRRLALGASVLAVVTAGLGVWRMSAVAPALPAATPQAPAMSAASPVPPPSPTPAPVAPPASEPTPTGVAAGSAGTAPGGDVEPTEQTREPVQEDTPTPPRPAEQHAQPASFRVESSPAGLVKVNGKSQGRSPVLVKGIPAGTARVEVSDPQLGFSKTQTFKLKSGDNGTLRLEAGQGQVSFLVLPYATVAVDGKTLGETPLGPIALYEGPHVVKLTNDKQSAPVTIKYWVKPGPQRFTYNLNAPREP